jgi:hypothetical protein
MGDGLDVGKLIVLDRLDGLLDAAGRLENTHSRFGDFLDAACGLHRERALVEDRLDLGAEGVGKG